MSIDHSFLKYKKELAEYGWQVGNAKWAVKNGMMEAYKKIEEKRAQNDLTADKGEVE